MAMKEIDLLQGTLDLLVLKTLSGGPMHGYRIAARIREALQSEFHGTRVNVGI